MQSTSKAPNCPNPSRSHPARLAQEGRRAVERDENLIDVETDKVVLEMPAPAAGVLVKLLKGERAAPPRGELIAEIDTEAKGPAPLPPRRYAARGQAAAPAAAPAPAAGAAQSSRRRGVDTADVSGSGRGGRVTKADVPGAAQRLRRPAPRARGEPAVPVRELPRSQPRAARADVAPARLVAERLRSRSPHCDATTFNE